MVYPGRYRVSSLLKMIKKDAIFVFSVGTCCLKVLFGPWFLNIMRGKVYKNSYDRIILKMIGLHGRI